MTKWQWKKVFNQDLDVDCKKLRLSKKTRIYETYEDFKNREDKTINGVSKDFAINYPNYEEMNETNKGCWNCSCCSNCVDCEGCDGLDNIKNFKPIV